MASPDTQHVVVNSQSTADASAVDSHDQPSDQIFTAGGADTIRDSEELPQQANGQGAVPDGDAVSVDGSARETGSVADVGSDTDNSRADDQGKDGSGALKSAKKPTMFKAVSVTRNFLAKTASAATAAVKPGEKPATAPGTPLTWARPRLVAKSGSGLRDSPRPSSGAESPADGATVWNKNRPAPPAPAKHFTDEELKQQYGIHLASRLQADDDNKQGKWADLDDDEDDWAPETVVWMDGTKSTIHPEPLPVAPAKPTITIEPRPTEARTILTALKRPTGPPKTVLRPGAALEQAKQDLAVKDTPSKAIAPPPSKSPWAVLPPVDKAAPLTAFGSLQNTPQRAPAGSQDARMMDGSFHTSVAREMEADTFDRTWRESDRGPRELFNSHSGRYEPAPEGRRGSMRREQGFKGPAVLRRPSQSAGSDAIMDGNSWPRRRGSSITAHDAPSFERRVSLSQKGPDTAAPTENRTGVVIGHDIGPQAKQPSKQALNAQQQAAAREEELLRQKRVMQEKRELAIRRRKEEEEREEAAKRERIRLKLESLGPGPSKSSPAQTSATANVAQQADQLAAQQATDAATAGAESRLKSEPLATARSEPGSQPQTTASQSSRSAISRSPEKTKASVSSQTSSITSPTLLSSYNSSAEAKAYFRSPGLSPESFATWGNRSGQSGNNAVSNVWGPAGPSRHIGNGAFTSSFSRVPPRMQNNLAQSEAFPPHQGARSLSTGPRQETSPMRHQQMLQKQNLAALGLADLTSPNYPPGMTPIDTASLPTQAQQAPLSPIAPPGRPAHGASSVQQSPRRGPPSWTQFGGHAQEDGVGPRWKEAYRHGKAPGEWTGARPQHLTYGDDPSPPIIHSQHLPTTSGQPRESTVRLPTASASSSPASNAPFHSQAPANAVGSHHSRFFPGAMPAGGSPPPEDSSLAVYSGGNARKPTVNLPTPKPHVRLPPAALAALQAQANAAVIMPERTASYRGGAQPLVQSSDWQARFNGLFGRIQTTTAIPPSPPRTPPKIAAVPSPAPLSSSKGTLLETGAGLPATVSLPFRASNVRAGTDMTSKPTVDDIFDGELSFGSTPKVSVPRSPTYSTEPDRSGIHILNMRPNARFDKPVDSYSRPTAPREVPSNRSISVHIPHSTKGAREIHLPAQQAERIFSEGGFKSRKPSTRGGKAAKIAVGPAGSETSTPAQSPSVKERKASSKFPKALKVSRSRAPADKAQPAPTTAT